MKICLLVEGSYPYVVGGVSSWVQLLMEGLPEHEFIVYSIDAEAKNRGKFKYKFPENMGGITEIFLDEILALKSPSLQQGLLDANEKRSLFDLVNGEKDIDLDPILKVFSMKRQRRNPLSIFMSSDFFEIISDVYREKYSYLPFTDFFWTMRSMLLPLFYFFYYDLPEADLYHSSATGYCGVVGSVAGRLYNKPFLLTEHGIYSRERETEIVKCSWAEGDFKSVWIEYFYGLAKLAYNLLR